MTELTASDLIERSFEWYADDIAIVDVPNQRHLTFEEVGKQSYRLANAFQELVPAGGTRIATLMENRAEFVTIDFATSLVGDIRVGLNTRLTADEHRYILRDCGAKVLLYSDRYQETVETIREDVPVEHFISVDDPQPSDRKLEAITEDHTPDPPAVSVQGGNYDYIMYTSGTTGRPKGAVHTQAGRVAATRNMLAEELTIDSSSSMLHLAPLTHGSGSKLITFFTVGARNVILDEFDPLKTLRTIESEMITNMFVVPTIIKRLLEVGGKSEFDISSLEQISYGGEPIPSDVLESAVEYFGPVFTQVYGAAEMPHPVTVLGTTDHQLDDDSRLSSAGRPVSNVHVAIHDDDGQHVEAGEVGEIVVKGPNVMAGYWERFDATTAAFDDEWFHTGDLGRQDADGLITIVGRKKEMIISGGMNVYPAQVEDTIQKHAGVRDVAVVGIDDPKWGEKVKGFVVRTHESSVSEEEIRSFAEGYIAKYKVPKEIEFVSELPKGSTGKILKRELKRRG